MSALSRRSLQHKAGPQFADPIRPAIGIVNAAVLGAVFWGSAFLLWKTFLS